VYETDGATSRSGTCAARRSTAVPVRCSARARAARG